MIKTIVITGSTRGIGFGMAKAFIEEGHQVIINGTTVEGVNKALLQFRDFNNCVIGVPGSVCEVDNVKKIIEEANSKFGKIDIWINNAGLPQSFNSIINMEDHEIREVFEVNLLSLVIASKYIANYMVSQGFGKIFNMNGFGSDGRVMNKLSIYGTTKRSVNYFSKAMSVELNNCSIQVGTLNPGMVRTDFLKESLSLKDASEARRFEKVYKAFAEEVEVVAPYLVRKILKSTKNNEKINFLNTVKLIVKLVKYILS